MTGVRVPAVFTYISPSGQQVPLRVELKWSPADPHAVELWFPRDGKQWFMARELLVDALTSDAAGQGDVQFQRPPGCPECVEVEFTSPSGHAEFHAPRTALIDLIVGSELGFRSAVDAWQETWLEGVVA